MAAERPKFVKEMPVSRADLGQNELRNYGKPFCPAFLMVGHDCRVWLGGREMGGWVQLVSGIKKTGFWAARTVS